MRRIIFSAALLLVLATSDIASAQFRAGIRIGGGGPYYGGYGSGYSGSVRIGGVGASYGNYGYAPYGYNRGWGYGGNRYYYGSPNYYYAQPNIVLGPTIAAPVAAPVTMNVMVPRSDAEVFVNGTITTSKGTERSFESRPLQPGVPYTYTLKARWMEKGRMVELTGEVPVVAGGTFTIDFRDEDN